MAKIQIHFSADQILKTAIANRREQLAEETGLDVNDSMVIEMLIKKGLEREKTKKQKS